MYSQMTSILVLLNTLLDGLPDNTLSHRRTHLIHDMVDAVVDNLM